MKKKFRVLSLMKVLLLSACNLGSQQQPEVVEDTAPATEIAQTEAASTDAQAATSAPTIQHEKVPGDLPAERSGLAGDQDSSVTAAENRAPAGDRFTFGRFERPFSADSMDVYYSSLDIVSSEVYEDEEWIYGVISMKNDDSGCNLTGRYGYEIDLNIDGGGDILVLASAPASTDWNTTGVQVWFDENDNVGGSLKSLTDETPVENDGYEVKLFDDGAGDDADLAWVRISPDDPCTVQLAVKQSLLDGNPFYLIGMWSGTSLFDPALFDHNDAYTHDQAGSSLIEFEYYYPVKEVYELDNGCRISVYGQ